MEKKIVGMEDLVGRTELESGMERGRRSLAEEGNHDFVEDSPVEEVRRTVVGEGEECWRSLEQEGIAGLLVHSWAEEGIEADRNPAAHIAVEEDNHPAVGHRRSNRCLTL